MSHKPAYGAKKKPEPFSQKELERLPVLLLESFLCIFDFFYNAGFRMPKPQTTTSSVSGALSGNKRRPRSQAQARKPKRQK